MTESGINRVAVIGSGVMGAGIAAQIANAGIPVLLLDLPGADAAARSAAATGAIARMGKSDALMSPELAELITPGNLDDDFHRIAECDWIVEVVLERLDIKQALYRRLETVRKPGTPISSNTSTIPLSALTADLSDAFRRDCFITHFFNPPRFMRLLELVTGPETDLAAADRVADFIDRRLGKTIVRCNDTPGFIANRLGVYWLQRGLIDALDFGLSVEEADAVMGRPLGIPKTGVFGLLDLIGIDLMPHINASLGKLLPQTDAFHAAQRDVPLVGRMVADGLTGRKGKGGFYRLQKAADGSRTMEAMDLASGSYRATQAPDPAPLKGAEKDLRGFLSGDGKINKYAWSVIGHTLAYAAGLVPEAVGSITGVDDAMRLGYGWKWGPFELIDRLGAGWLRGRLEQDNIAIPPLLRDIGDRTFYTVENGRRMQFTVHGTHEPIERAPGVLLLGDVKLNSEPLLRNASAALWDIGDGVACFEFAGKGNALDTDVMALLEQTIELIPQAHRALVIYNDGAHFSFGANLSAVVAAAKAERWSEIEALITNGQKAFAALGRAPFPVVAAPAGMALGGGCEVLLWSSAIQAHAELVAGLVECGVGLIPGWGGCYAMLERIQASGKADVGDTARRAFKMISAAERSKSAADAQRRALLRAADGITMNRDRLLFDAKAKALALVGAQDATHLPKLKMAGTAVRVELENELAARRDKGELMPHEITVSYGLARVLTGGDHDGETELGTDEVFALERDVFMRLVKTPATLARIEHTLATGKPLRN